MDQRNRYEREIYAVADRLIASGVTISAMESCTGGLFASMLTDRSGASDIFPGSFVTYSNEEKVKCGVPKEVIETFGVYSEQTACAMAEAAAAAFETQIGIGITGSLGRKDPKNPDSVDGQVRFGICYRGKVHVSFLQIPEECAERRTMKIFVVYSVLKKAAELIEE